MLDLVSFIPRAVAQGIPLLFGSTGEIVTERPWFLMRMALKSSLER